ncbi:S-adenosyl-L-methionine-dependent methyltransferase [Aspergillus ibericus CBS 121593]|uniref:S-adenosyl-L-methionine-dependent methyltransferase n=1 Tax=Aspergillus ibericus CBS 121593 TaxID=1448316 RepID=A0A395GPC8_9EURO|nr:S-adenosyl-L-methionine-dependent methyltransferase [Aspergillus ibericus CBS 121593]RAK97329.1 S-adenosyl-L-methionine-dependent methyltransferase [Aspergillus ibericus CBS 121593]
MSVAELIHSINSVTTSGALEMDEQQRAELAKACNKLQEICESPQEKTFKLLLSGHQSIVLRLAIDLKLFDAIMHRSSEDETGKVNVNQLATDTTADPALIARIMRFLSAMDILTQHTSDTFTPTPSAAAYVSTSHLAAAIIHFTHFHTILTHLPTYFTQTNYTNPTSPTNTPFQSALSTTSNYFEYLATKPYYQSAFNTVMASPFRRSSAPWFTLLPSTHDLFNPTSASPNEVRLVDIGGSHGSDLHTFQQAYPSLAGRLILQDLPHVISAGIIPNGIEPQGYDFFTEQPVKGARCYMLRTVLHDWPDVQAEVILQRVKDAMTTDSTLLVVEKVLPETDVGLLAAVGDWSMMVSFAGRERTEVEWRGLLGKVGLGVVGIYMGSTSGGEGMDLAVLEARVL